MRFRTERDSIGKKKVPYDAYYGIFTVRALENFSVSELRMEKEILYSIAKVKIAAAEANSKLKLLSSKFAKAMIQAAKEILAGKFDDQLFREVYQAGAGTAMNMNINEIVANRSIELLGGKKGDYTIIHPNDHVNLAQSSNDVVPTAIRIAALEVSIETLRELDLLEKSFRKKGKQFKNILKLGRTHLQDAVPITLGQEFLAYASVMKKHHKRVSDVMAVLSNVPLGGTAIGTGVNSHPNYKKLAVKSLSKLTGFKLKSSKNLIEATQFSSDFLSVSNTLNELAVDLSKICNDLRLLSSGPRAGMYEIILPEVEPGSSIIPGKVNPSIPEMVNMICFQISGSNKVIEECAAAGQLELNIFTPMMGHQLIKSFKLLTGAMRELNQKCVKGIKVNKSATDYYFRYGLGLATLVAPKIGYDQAAILAKRAKKEHKTVAEIILSENILSRAELKKLLSRENSTKPNLK